jgi:hypothetical protein
MSTRTRRLSQRCTFTRGQESQREPRKAIGKEDQRQTTTWQDVSRQRLLVYSQPNTYELTVPVKQHPPSSIVSPNPALEKASLMKQRPTGEATCIIN